MNKKFSIEELLQDAEVSLINAELENDTKKIEFFTAARDFLLEHYKEENIFIGTNED